MSAVNDKRGPCVFDYLKFADFVRDYTEHRKSIRPSYTYRQVARRSGFKSPDYLTMILAGKRKLTRPNALSLASALEIKPQERNYFLALVEWNQASSSSERDIAWHAVLQSAPTKAHILNESETQIFSRWYILALYELLTLPQFKADPLWISRKFRGAVSMKEAAEGLEILLNCGLAEVTNGIWRRGKGTLSAGGVPSDVIKNYHAKVIDQAKEALYGLPFEERTVTNTTLAISSARLAEFNALIAEFQRRAVELAETTTAHEADTVYNLSLQLVPMTHSDKN
jgi:uncharacterized protein (TIGR02147 family)